MPRYGKLEKQLNSLLTHPELYEGIGIKPLKRVLLHREPKIGIFLLTLEAVMQEKWGLGILMGR